MKKLLKSLVDLKNRALIAVKKWIDSQLPQQPVADPRSMWDNILRYLGAGSIDDLTAKLIDKITADNDAARQNEIMANGVEIGATRARDEAIEAAHTAFRKSMEPANQLRSQAANLRTGAVIAREAAEALGLKIKHDEVV